MILNLQSDTFYLTAKNAQSRAEEHYYLEALTKNSEFNKLNDANYYFSSTFSSLSQSHL